MSIMYYQTTKWKVIWIEKEYEQRITNKMARSIKTFNAQQLACKAVLNNFAINSQPDNYIDELKFSLKWWLKLAK